jgi:hypothetical protein
VAPTTKPPNEDAGPKPRPTLPTGCAEASPNPWQMRLRPTTANECHNRTPYPPLNCLYPFTELREEKHATISIIQQATADSQCLALLLQDLWNKADRDLPPGTPGFDLFSPTPMLANRMAYARPGMPAVQRFTDGDSFLEMVITIDCTSFSLLNFRSPGHPKHVAQLITACFRRPKQPQCPPSLVISRAGPRLHRTPEGVAGIERPSRVARDPPIHTL